MLAIKDETCSEDVNRSLNGAGTKLSQRLFLVLDAVRVMGRPVSLGEIALRTGLPKSTVHRLVRDLEAAGFVDRTSSDSYYLGLSLFSYGERARQQHELRQIATRHLAQLASETGAMVQLAVTRDDQALVVERVIGRSGIVLPARVGALIPLHIGALGKVILAGLPALHLAETLAATEERFGGRVGVDRHALRLELDKVRARGFAFEREGAIDGLTCFAAPIYAEEVAVPAGLSVSFNRRLRQTERVEVVRVLLAAKSRIESHFELTPTTTRFSQPDRCAEPVAGTRSIPC